MSLGHPTTFLDLGLSCQRPKSSSIPLPQMFLPFYLSSSACAPFTPLNSMLAEQLTPLHLYVTYRYSLSEINAALSSTSRKHCLNIFKHFTLAHILRSFDENDFDGTLLWMNNTGWAYIKKGDGMNKSKRQKSCWLVQVKLQQTYAGFHFTRDMHNDPATYWLSTHSNTYIIIRFVS